LWLLFVGVNSSPERVVVGVFGMAGSGKSSLIRALCEQDIVEDYSSSDREGTLSIQTFNCPSTQTKFVDTPGFGTCRFPTRGYLKRYLSPEIDIILFVVVQRLYEPHHEFVEQYRLLSKRKRLPPIILIRSQVDVFPVKNDTLEFIQKELANVPVKSFAITTNKEHELYGNIEELKSAIDAFTRPHYRLARVNTKRKRKRR